ncbi:MAG TPA: Na+/H+ antiporter NhaA [Candidatus Paceibacterota bacterium]|nr:Na+/H+ antiporter NhaA [Candidatus Paceibacterota bacterium]
MPRRIPQTFRRFIAIESSGGIVLVLAAVIALICANSPFKIGYEEFWRPGEAFINEGLMSIFFFLVGLEIKREFIHGELRDPKKAALPVLGAIGGMILPALIYALVNQGGDGSAGWAVPMPTDIALAVGALTLLGSRINPSLKIFLLSLAIADDLGSILVLGVFYSDGLSPLKIASTIGAVLFAWIIPTRTKLPLNSLIDWIHPWSSYLVIPVFALANIGVTIDFSSLQTLITSPISLGIIIGRVVGKFIGITLFVWLAVRIGIARMPGAVSMKEIAGVAALGGMGLTVSLFIADLAMKDPTQLSQVKTGLIISAILSAFIGLGILRKATSIKPE